MQKREAQDRNSRSRPSLMVVGAAGLHATKVYIPALLNEARIEVSALVDLDAKHEELLCVARGFNSMPEVITSAAWRSDVIPEQIERSLDDVVSQRNVVAAIIATEPLSHLAYLRWAIERDLHVLVDKPIVAYPNVSNDPAVARRVLSDFVELSELADTHSDRLIAVAVQRRYQAGFELARELVVDAAETHGCPVTAISSTHADGQLRLPHEIETIAYHGYRDGYGKLHHSGEHIVDFQAQTIALAADAAGVTYDGLESHASSIRPAGFLQHVPRSTYERQFGRTEWCDVASASELELSDRHRRFGELDLIANNTFSSESLNVLLSQIRLLHNSYSRRAWLQPNADLYKGNGRVKHERHEINQSFFQTVMIDSFQAKSDHRVNDAEEFRTGGNNHLVVRVFRNAEWWPTRVTAYEEFDAEALARESGLSAETLFTDHAKQTMVGDFLACISGEKSLTEHRSRLQSHLLTSQMMAAMSEALALEASVQVNLRSVRERALA
jgi:hypothetical protein